MSEKPVWLFAVPWRNYFLFSIISPHTGKTKKSVEAAEAPDRAGHKH